MSDIKKEMIHGVFWNAVEKYSGLAISLVVSMILARLLSPEEYGIVAIATVFISFLQMFCTMGIAPAIIQRNDLTAKNLDSIYTFCLIIGLVLSALFFIVSWPIADIYGNQQLVPVCQLLSLLLLFTAANMIPNALMNKQKLFKNVAQRTLALQIVTGALSVVAAWNGWGVYSLTISPILTAIGIFVWNRKYIRLNIDWKVDMEPLKRIYSYSSYQFLFELVNYFSRNLDKLIIGKWISMGSLGIYEKSYRLMQLPMQNITSVISPVMQPVLKDLQNTPHLLADKYAKIIKFVATLSFPIGAILFGMSKECILLFYGDKWDAAIPVFSILALSLPLQMILSTSGAILLICNATKLQFWLGIRNTVTTVAGFLLAAFLFKSIESMAWAWTITLAINFVITYYFIYKKAFSLSVSHFYPLLWRPLLTGLCIVSVLQILTTALQQEGYFALWGQTTIKLLISVIVCLLSIHLTGQYNFKKIIHSKFQKHD